MTSAFSIHDVVKTYSDFQLGPLDLDLQLGTVLGYVGPNGSGKTTTMHCLVGLVKKDCGEIKICGVSQQTDYPAWKADIG